MQQQQADLDVLVIGSGVACQSIVFRLREAGRSVGVIENGPPGGTCKTRGCDAKKPYVNAAKRVLQARAMIGHGVTGDLQLDWLALAAFKDSFTDPVPGQTRREMADAGIKLIEGPPRFIDPHTVEVNGQRVRGEQVVIATGRRPRTLDLPGAEHAITSDDFLELKSLPRRVVFIGGGYIAMEFAGVAAVAGSEVTVVEAGDYPLKPFDRDAVRTVMAALTDLGVTILTRRRVTAVESLDAGKGFRVVTGEQEPAINADLVINASGRVPSLNGLNLDAVGIAHGKAGLQVDEFLRSTSHHHVWAAGDVADNHRAPLTPTASEDGRVVAHNLIHGPTRTRFTSPVASVAFTLPPIAGVGLSESDAREKFGNIEVVAGDMSTWKHFRQQGEKHATFKLIFCDQQLLRGAHLVGAECEEVINLFALAIGEGCHKDTLCDATFGYPTVAFNLLSKFKTHAASTPS